MNTNFISESSKCKCLGTTLFAVLLLAFLRAYGKAIKTNANNKNGETK